MHACIEPLPPSIIEEIETMVGPIDPIAAAKIETTASFNYHQATGMLIFAAHIGCFDVSEAITKLCHHNEHPAPIHYNGVKHVFHYLCQTIDQGLIFWCPPDKYVDSLPSGNFIPKDNIDPDFPFATDPFQLCLYIDASYGGHKKDRHSISGICACIGGTANYAHTKTQPTISLSSTKAELIAACLAEKATR